LAAGIEALLARILCPGSHCLQRASAALSQQPSTGCAALENVKFVPLQIAFCCNADLILTCNAGNQCRLDHSFTSQTKSACFLSQKEQESVECRLTRRSGIETLGSFFECMRAAGGNW
jgi:hypothetical protein